jgi:hypothetical protein
VAERRNRIILNAARTMLIEGNVTHIHWKEAVSTTVYSLNRSQIREGTNKTPYDLWFGHTPTMKYFRIFGSKCYIKRDDEIGKFDARSDEGIFLSYSTKSKAYRCFNLILGKIVESANVRIDERFQVQERMYENEIESYIKVNNRNITKKNVEEEVYIEQIEGFLLTNEGDMVCKLKRALYGLKQVPRAWYAWLEKY